MPSITIDAGVLAIPPELCDADDAHHYVQTLLDWSELLDAPWVAIYMSERASEALFKDDLYPLRNQLSRLFQSKGIIEYSVNDIIPVVDRLLQRTPSFETFFSIKDVLTENLFIEPDILRLCSGTNLKTDLARCLVLLAILRHHCQESVRDHSLILRSAPDRTVRVRALIHELDHQRNDLREIPVPPDYFEGDVLVCDDFRGLIECLDKSAIMLSAIDNIGIETAIRIAIYKARLGNETEPEWDDVPSHRIGHAFRTSLQGVHPTRQIADGLLRAIVETLEKNNMPATHILRTGQGGNDPQLVRRSDQAKAWRRDVDREHHLHYWLCEDHTIEIASLSFPHNDFFIPE